MPFQSAIIFGLPLSHVFSGFGLRVRTRNNHDEDHVRCVPNLGAYTTFRYVLPQLALGSL